MKKLFQSARWLLLTLLLPLIPAAQAHAGVYISVNFGPPVLPVYVQPPCPDPDLIWTPGYWAYGPDGYYWVPGAWVPAPYAGALWTPPYWGFENGLYLFHPGYWGHHVGYYGGINYGFGYFGIGFVGGGWHGDHFRYNTAVWNVNRGRIHNVYEDRAIVRRNTIVNERRVAFNGGPGGINHRPSGAERSYMNERHVSPTSFQSQHELGARNDRTSYARANNGRPQNLVAQRPLQMENRQSPGTMRPTFNNQRPANNSVPGGRAEFNNGARFGNQNGGANRPGLNQSQQQRPTFNQPQQQRPTFNQPQQQQAQRPTFNQQQQARPTFNQPQQQRPTFNQSQQQARPTFNQSQQQARPTFNQPQQQRPNFNQQVNRPAAPQMQRSAPQFQRSAPQVQRQAPQMQRSAPQVQRSAPQQQHAAPPQRPHGPHGH